MALGPAVPDRFALDPVVLRARRHQFVGDVGIAFRPRTALAGQVEERPGHSGSRSDRTGRGEASVPTRVHRSGSVEECQ
jgi:hypothetical protein